MTAPQGAPLYMVDVAASMVRTAASHGGSRMPEHEASQWIDLLHEFARIGARMVADSSGPPGSAQAGGPADVDGGRS